MEGVREGRSGSRVIEMVRPSIQADTEHQTGPVKNVAQSGWASGKK